MLRLAFRGDMPRFLRNRLSGCSDEQGLITSASLFLSRTPPPRYPRRTCFKLPTYNSEEAKYEISDHFVDVNKMVAPGLGSEREITDIMLTRYACHLIAQNGDPRKECIRSFLFAQSYFTVQTRRQEVIEEHIRLAERLKARERLRESETELTKYL